MAVNRMGGAVAPSGAVNVARYWSPKVRLGTTVAVGAEPGGGGSGDVQLDCCPVRRSVTVTVAPPIWAGTPPPAVASSVITLNAGARSRAGLCVPVSTRSVSSVRLMATGFLALEMNPAPTLQPVGTDPERIRS